MVSEKFRHQLMKEAQQWQEENLIDSPIYEQLSRRYEFDKLATSARNRFVVVLVMIGSVLLGLSVITFVAANWDQWTREIKVVILLGVFLISNMGAFYLWSNSQEKWQYRLGLGLFVVAGLILGANMGLMSQMFHQSGPIYQLYLLWGIGIFVMAFSLRITSLGIFSFILLTIAYLWGYYEVFYGINQPLIFQILIQHFPTIIGAGLILLAYWCRSSWLFGLTVFLIITTFFSNLTTQASDIVSFSPFLSAFFAVISYSFVPGFFYGYNDNLWGINLPISNSFARISRSLAMIIIGLIIYVFSFQGLWDNGFTPRDDLTFNWQNLANLIDPIILFSLSLLAWWRLGLNNGQKTWKIDLNTTVIASFLIINAFCLFIHIAITPIGWVGVFIYNVILALLGIGLIRESLGNGKRGGFWLGIVLVVLQIFSRMLEYDTSLLLKAFVFFLCGIGIIFAGLWFERYVKTLSQ